MSEKIGAMSEKYRRNPDPLAKPGNAAGPRNAYQGVTNPESLYRLHRATGHGFRRRPNVAQLAGRNSPESVLHSGCYLPGNSAGQIPR